MKPLPNAYKLITIMEDQVEVLLKDTDGKKNDSLDLDTKVNTKKKVILFRPNFFFIHFLEMYIRSKYIFLSCLIY